MFDCISIKNGEQGISSTFENKAKQRDMNLHVFFCFIYVLRNNVNWQ